MDKFKFGIREYVFSKQDTLSTGGLSYTFNDVQNSGSGIELIIFTDPVYSTVTLYFLQGVGVVCSIDAGEFKDAWDSQDVSVVLRDIAGRIGVTFEEL